MTILYIYHTAISFKLQFAGGENGIKENIATSYSEINAILNSNATSK